MRTVRNLHAVWLQLSVNVIGSQHGKCTTKGVAGDTDVCVPVHLLPLQQALHVIQHDAHHI